MSDDGDKPRDRPPTSRLGRLAKLAALAPRTVPFALEGAKRALGVKPPDPDEARKRLRAEAKKTAEAMLKTFGEMKGLPLKIGQMASYIDGIAPPGYEERFQAALKRLLDKAPPLSAAAAETVVRSEFGRAPDEVFARWTAEPFAAASIGQVHRAATRHGDDVAVKVQYPGIDAAIENDLRSVSLLQSMAGPLADKLHTKETLEEIRAVILGELDYGREGEMADRFRRLHDGDPGIVVPRVHHALTTRRVLTTDFVDGVGYADFAAKASPEEASRAGMIIWRFTFRALFKHGLLYADPHPGNYRFLPDGRVAFLDFGCVKELPEPVIAGMKRYMLAAVEGDWETFDRVCVDFLGYDPSDPSWTVYRGYTTMLLEPLRAPSFKWTQEAARETVQYLARGLRELAQRDDAALPAIPFVPKMPKDLTFVNRLQWGLASVLAGLGTEGNFGREIEPWLRGPVERV